MTQEHFNPKVFISYSHESKEHTKKVLGLHAALLDDGCECDLDVYKNSGEDWQIWMLKQLDAADFILCVITEIYKRRFEGYDVSEKGKGVAREAKIMTHELYDNKYVNKRIIPVFFQREEEKNIPRDLKGYDFFSLENDQGYTDLYRKLTQQPEWQKPKLGKIKELKTETVERSFSLLNEKQSPVHSENQNSDKISKKQACWERVRNDVIEVLGKPGTMFFEHFNENFEAKTAKELADKLFCSPIEPILDNFQHYLKIQIKSENLLLVQSIERISHIWLALIAAECEQVDVSKNRDTNSIHLKATLPIKPDVEGQLAANENRAPILILIGEHLWSPLDFSPKLPNGYDKYDSDATDDFKRQAVGKTCSGMQAFVSDVRNEFKDFLCGPQTGLNRANIDKFSKEGIKKILTKKLKSHSKDCSGNIYIRIPYSETDLGYSELEELYHLYQDLLIVKVTEDIDEDRSPMVIQLNEIIYEAKQFAIKKNQN